MYGIQHRQFDIVFTEHVHQELLTFDLWQLAKVAVTPEQIEGVVHETALPACSQLCLKLGEIRPAFMDYHDLAIDDGFARDGERACDLGKALGPV